MPELPEVETVRCGLEQSILGAQIERVILNRKDLRIPFPPQFAKQLTGAKIVSVDRRAKYLLIHLDHDQVVIVHLGMSGKMLVMPAAAYQAKAHDHVLWYLRDGLLVVFHDPRRFGLMTLCPAAEIEQHPLLAHLGPEPLGNRFHAAYLAEQLSRRQSAIKLAIMDQHIVVGVGNIYACEALFMSGIDPRIPAKEAANQSELLVRSIKKVLKAAIQSGGSTLRDYVRSSGDAGYFQHHFQVYGREGEGCFTCQSPIRRMVQGGRSTFFCDECQ